MLFNVIVILFYITNILCIDYDFNERVDVNTTSGLVRGHTIQVLNTSVNEFLGIPYAKPPTGELRFAKPQPIETQFKGVIDATKGKNACIQGLVYLGPNEPQSEDCLFLNIWSPESDDQNSTQLKPVMFWLHGGGFVSGSIFQFHHFNGSVFPSYDVILVATNYRLGPFGFLYGADETAPGNVGLYDQLLALKWVRENIHLFGGDKDQITIFGESAGSWSVSAHILSPLSKGLYKRAVMESGAQMFKKGIPVLSKSDALKKSKEMAKHFNCSENWLKCLREINANDIREYYRNPNQLALEETEFIPIPAVQALQEGMYSKDIDIMAGVTTAEGSLLTQYYYPVLHFDVNETVIKDLILHVNQTLNGFDVKKVTEFYLAKVNTNSSDDLKMAFYQFFGDLGIKCPTYLFAKLFARHTPDKGVYFYELTYQRKFVETYGCIEKTMGICHGSEVYYVFGIPLIIPQNTDTHKDIDFSYEVMKMWTNFAKNGKPNTNWPQLINTGDENPIPKIQELNPNKMNHIFEDHYKRVCDELWNDYFI